MTLIKKLFAFILLVFISLLISCENPSSNKSNNEEDQEDPSSSNGSSNLLDLSISDGTLIPDFSVSVTEYAVYLPNAINKIIVTGKKEDSSSTVSENNGVPQSLKVGQNTISIIVTSASGEKKTYTVTVNRHSFALNMIQIPSGRFQRDDTNTNISSVSSFKMSAHEITRMQYQLLMGIDPVVDYSSYSFGLTDPVFMVSWYHAIAFCNKLSLAEGLDPIYSVTGVSDWRSLKYDDIPTTNDSNWSAVTAKWGNNGYRLPTEMEWMWAAMGAPSDGQNGGTNTSAYGNSFSGNNGAGAVGDYAWYDDNSSNMTHPVGEKLPNELGLYDMSGNAREWCWDWYADYLSGSLSDSRGSITGTQRTLRGGAWFSSAAECTVWARYSFDPYTPNYNGFRVVRP